MNLRFEKTCSQEDEKLIHQLAKTKILRYEDQTVVPFRKALEWKEIDIHANIGSFVKVYDGDVHIGYFDLYQTVEFIYVVSDLLVLPAYQGYEAEIIAKIIEEADDVIEVRIYQKDDTLYDVLENAGFFLSRLVSRTSCVMKYNRR